MYCPKCLNSSLYLCDHGVINLIINKKQMDAGRFLYNLNDQSKDELVEELSQKIEEFFKWYSNFKNKEDIEVVQLVTTDVFCENKCSIGLSSKVSVIDLLIPKSVLLEVLEELGKKYNMNIKIEAD